jgi:hypothetical protein
MIDFGYQNDASVMHLFLLTPLSKSKFGDGKKPSI